MNKYNLLGVKSEKELDIDNPIIYKSKSLISSMKYSGSAEIIKKSTSIDNDFKEKLSKINGYFSLGVTNKELRNAHIYSSQAEYLDSIERICYVQQEKEDLLISEYYGNRGSKYSSLYRELDKRLLENKFKKKQAKFVIEKDRAEEFVNIINELIEDRENNKLELIVKEDIDSISIRGEKYFYFKVYWEIKTKNLVKVKNKVQNEDDKFNGMIKDIAELVLESNDVELLNNINNKLINLNNLISNRIENINQLNSF